MGIQASAKIKYQLIHETLMQKDNILNVSALCRIAGVSRSGYYAWIHAASARQEREEQDLADFALIKQIDAVKIKRSHNESRTVRISTGSV